VAIKIDKGVPVPVRTRSDLGLAMSVLEVGDSFLFPKALRYQVGQRAISRGIKVVTQSEDADNIRVWRVA
jgi:hypothetical protein